MNVECRLQTHIFLSLRFHRCLPISGHLATKWLKHTWTKMGNLVACVSFLHLYLYSTLIFCLISISFERKQEKIEQILTFRNQFGNTTFRYEQNTIASEFSSMNNIADIVHDNMYQRLSWYTDRILVESTSRIMLFLVSMQFCYMD